MAKLFISFLGLGKPPNVERPMTVPGYDKAHYSLAGKEMPITRFSQRAILEYHGIESFDSIVLLMTPESKERHLEILKEELVEIGLKDGQIQERDCISNSMDTEEQWRWFETLLECIKQEDEVIFDFTHGFRSVPIVFSTAISFVQKLRKITLLHAYYGNMFPELGNKDKGEIIDLAPFYEINDWATAVSSLVESADASQLAELAKKAHQSSFTQLKDPELIGALVDLSNIVKNIDMHRVYSSAKHAITLLKTKKNTKEGPSKELIQTIIDKFASLIIFSPKNETYDAAYFKLQLNLIKLLIDHSWYMQTFTVLSECIASIGMLGAPVELQFYTKGNLVENRKFADVFLAMLNIKEKKWKFADGGAKRQETLLPFYNQLKELKIEEKLRKALQKIKTTRDSFSHGWTAVSENCARKKQEKIQELALETYKSLSEIIDSLIKEKMIPEGEE